MSRFFFRLCLSLLLAIAAVTTFLHISRRSDIEDTRNLASSHDAPRFSYQRFNWTGLPQNYPVESHIPLPRGSKIELPRVQLEFDIETDDESHVRHKRLDAVKSAFLHSWEGYKSHAWLQDELLPLSAGARTSLGGWGATLVDSLDTLWIIGLKSEFEAAVVEVGKIDFTATTTTTLNVFETTIRFLGGLLGAFDISGQEYGVLLEKAVELGDMLVVVFDTPNRMPITRWDWRDAADGGEQVAEGFASLAEVGSLALEFTRLSQLTGEPKWYDAVARVTTALEMGQNQTRLPGLWPQKVNMVGPDFSKDSKFSMGGMADSTFEYLPKQHILLGGQAEQYRSMYDTSLATAKQNLFFQPLNPGNHQMLLAGARKRISSFSNELVPDIEHLSCFAGGMVALAAKVFEEAKDLDTARQLLDGCLWAYESSPSGIMPEVFTAVPCLDDMYDNCTWTQQSWHDAVAHTSNRHRVILDPEDESAQQTIMQNNLPPGMIGITDPRYLLRPETIESMFVLYRITGDKALQDRAWAIFERIDTLTRTNVAYAAIEDVTQDIPRLLDNMESFWTAETLKYFYLIFSKPNVVSLDDYVLNTEAHPLRRPK